MPMSVNNLLEIVQHIKSGMPPETLFSSKDAALFIANKDLLISLGEDLVQGFYGIVLSHDKTKAIFKASASDFGNWSILRTYPGIPVSFESAHSYSMILMDQRSALKDFITQRKTWRV